MIDFEYKYGIFWKWVQEQGDTLIENDRLSRTQKWLRKIYNIDVTAMPTGHNDKYFYEIRYNKEELIKVSEDYEKYEDALTDGLTEAIKIYVKYE